MLVDSQVVAEPEEVGQIRALPVREQRRGVAEIAQRSAVEEVDSDALILTADFELLDLEAQPDHAGAVADGRDVAVIGRVLAMGKFAEQRRTRPLAADEDRQRQRSVDAEDRVADQRLAVGRRGVDLGQVARGLRVVEVEDAIEAEADLCARQAVELLHQAAVGHVPLENRVRRSGYAAIGDLDRRTGRQRRAEDDRVGRRVVDDRGQCVSRAAGGGAARVVRRAVVVRDVDRADDRDLAQVDGDQRAGAGVERIGPVGGGRTRLDVAELRRHRRVQVDVGGLAAVGVEE